MVLAQSYALQIETAFRLKGDGTMESRKNIPVTADQVRYDFQNALNTGLDFWIAAGRITEEEKANILKTDYLSGMIFDKALENSERIQCIEGLIQRLSEISRR